MAGVRAGGTLDAGPLMAWWSALLALAAAGALAGSAQQVHVGRGSVHEAVERLQPGQWVWEPLAAPQGPLLMVVSLPRQRAFLFRNGVPIAATTISSGKPGFETPTGVFTVLEKDEEHYSSTYNNAPMPYMQRLTWRGVALHAGNLPGRPASHGCVRLPLEFARLLFATTHVGMTVVISDKRATPRIAPAKDLLPPAPARAVRGGSAAGAVAWQPELSPKGPVSIVVSAADGRAVVLRNGVQIGYGPVRVTGPVAGTWVYLLQQTAGGGSRWLRVDMASAGDPSVPVPPAEWNRFAAPPQFRQAVARILHPGATIIVTSDTLAASGAGRRTDLLENEPDRAP